MSARRTAMFVVAAVAIAVATFVFGGFTKMPALAATTESARSSTCQAEVTAPPTVGLAGPEYGDDSRWPHSHPRDFDRELLDQRVEYRRYCDLWWWYENEDGLGSSRRCLVWDEYEIEVNIYRLVNCRHDDRWHEPVDVSVNPDYIVAPANRVLAAFQSAA